MSHFTISIARRAIVALGLTAAITSHLSAQTPPKPPTPPAAPAGHAMAGMDMSGMTMDMLPPVRIPKGAIWTEADVRFMQGMIAHHAQAIYMSRMARGREASEKLTRFADKIDHSQQVEINLMQQWLRANNQFVPDTSSWHTMHMQGMLTDEQMAELDASKGVDFDRNFLELMIQHHEGAIQMVNDLLATPLAGQDVDVSVFANDVVNVQTAEINVMRTMLQTL